MGLSSRCPGCGTLAMVLAMAALVAGTLGQGSGSGQKQVQVSLSAPWGPAPLVLEAAEFWDGDSKGLFWDFVESLPTTAAAGSDKEQYDAVKKVAGEIASAAQVKLMIFAMALRSSSPKLEIHR